MLDAVLPIIEELVPLPANALDAMPVLSMADEVAMRARTIKLLADLTHTPIVPTEQDRVDAACLAKQMIENPKHPIEFAQYANETVAYLAGLVQQSNFQLVDELSELKNYVVNKLVWEVEHCKDAKTRVAALTKLGEVDGIDAFKKRSSIEHTFKTAKEVEDALSGILEGIEYDVLEPHEPKTSENDENQGEEGAEDEETDENQEETDENTLESLLDEVEEQVNSP